jgi:DNA/RNA-binding domain of Phe-tRNA-synthetase-like protein
MLRLIVHEDAYELGIRHPVACLIRNINISSQLCNVLTDSVQSMMDTILNHSQEILARPEVVGFHTLFEKLGYPNQTPAGQRLIEFLQTKGFKSYNNIVDSYNIASALFASGLGLHNTATITEDIQIFRAKGDETIKPLFQNQSQKIAKGDIIYTNGKNVIAWLGKKDVDSEDFKVSDDTTSLLLIALGNENTSTEYNRTACLTAIRLMRKTCPKIYGQFIQTIFTKGVEV